MKCPCCGGLVNTDVCSIFYWQIKSNHWPDLREVFECRRCHAVFARYDPKLIKDELGNALFHIKDKGLCLVHEAGHIVESIS